MTARKDSQRSCISTASALSAAILSSLERRAAEVRAKGSRRWGVREKWPTACESLVRTSRFCNVAEPLVGVRATWLNLASAEVMRAIAPLGKNRFSGIVGHTTHSWARRRRAARASNLVMSLAIRLTTGDLTHQHAVNSELQQMIELGIYWDLTPNIRLNRCILNLFLMAAFSLFIISLIVLSLDAEYALSRVFENISLYAVAR